MIAECERTRELLASVLLSETRSGEMEVIQRHLASCGGCREEADRQAALLGALSFTKVPDPGGDYWDSFLPRLRNRIAGEGFAAVRTWQRQGWAVAASLAVLLLGAAAAVSLEPAAGIKSRMAVDFIAARTSPGTLRLALDELLPGSEIAPRQVGRVTAPRIPEAVELQRALDSLAPPEAGDIDAVADGLSPEARRWLLQTWIPDRV